MIEISKVKRLHDKVFCTDCLKLLRKLPDQSIGLCVTSPPYNLKNSSGNGMKDGRGGKWKNAELQNGYATYSDDLPYDDYIAWQREILTETMRVLRDDGAIFYNHKWRVQDGLLQSRNEIVAGFPVRQIIIWKRNGGINFNDGYFLPTYEVIYLIAKPKFRLAPQANRYGDVWDIGQERDNDHPAPFPLELARRCIESTLDNGPVFDPFMGSGTTAVAATSCHRDWIGAEISHEYVTMTRKRLQTHMSDDNFKF